MQQKIWKWVNLITILIAVGKFVNPPTWGEVQAPAQIENNPLDPKIAEHIFQTSVQITMVKQVVEKKGTQPAEPDKKETWIEVTTFTSGIGTLVSHLGEIILISHDHWSLFTRHTVPDKVEFRDAKGTLLLEITGADMLSLILFHDGGTLILKAPKDLAARVYSTADFGFFETLKSGDIVQVVHHSPENEDQISIIAAEIVRHEKRNGVPVLSLRSLNGQSIKSEDSGGGIWINGRLVGNLWMTVHEVSQYWWQPNPNEKNETAFSLAAGLPLELVNLVETILQVEPSLSLERDGRS